MNIILNGESTQIPEKSTLTQLLEQLQFTPGRVAVEHNLEVAPRDRYSSIELNEGDQVEIVHFIGGGCR
ncbi:MAG: sulfur carrier protein ThiS [Magnetococcales bacterium]|nr:sulfur carrier protein ThiS [Magnetococcales bacterium]